MRLGRARRRLGPTAAPTSRTTPRDAARRPPALTADRLDRRSSHAHRRWPQLPWLARADRWLLRAPSRYSSSRPHVGFETAYHFLPCASRRARLKAGTTI